MEVICGLLMEHNMPKNFGRLVKDDNNQSIQVGGFFQCFDASDTPVESPIAALTDASVTTLTVPENATNVIFRPNADLKVSDASDMSTGYFLVPSGATHAFAVGGSEVIYIQSNSGALTLNFYFVTV